MIKLKNHKGNEYGCFPDCEGCKELFRAARLGCMDMLEVVIGEIKQLRDTRDTPKNSPIVSYADVCNEILKIIGSYDQPSRAIPRNGKNEAICCGVVMNCYDNWKYTNDRDDEQFTYLCNICKKEYVKAEITGRYIGLQGK